MKYLKRFAVMALTAVLVLVPALSVQGQQIIQNGSPLSRVGGMFYASAYNTWSAKVISGNAATGAGQSIIVGPATSLQDGRVVQVFQSGILSPVTLSDANAETFTPTAVSVAACPAGFAPGFSAATCATITGTIASLHGVGAVVVSGSAGLQEAILDASQGSGGMVVLDKAWTGTNAMIVAAIPYSNVSIYDVRASAPQYWNVQGGATTLAVPATLTAVTALPSTSPVGAFTATAYNMCIAYVDILGQEGPCSVSFVNTGAGATSSFIFTAPAASAGAVGYTIYVGLTGAGSTTLQYKVPLVTQPTVVGAYPVSNAVCTLTAVETVTPACAVANTTYNQSGATATVSAITVNTSPIQPLSSIVSTTAIFVPNAGGRTTFTYAPGSRIGTPGLPSAYLAFPVSGSAATTVPTVLGTVNVPPGFMNYLGRTIEVCGRAGITTGSTTTILTISFQWDSMGQNTAGKGVVIGNMGLTPVAAFSTTEMDNFCETFQTTATGATATGGSINTTGGYLATSGVSTAAAGQAAGGDPTTGTTALLNLAADARINVVYLHTTGTFAPTLQSLSVKVVN